ncbi:MAG: hypothetical protein WD066_12360 [Planctomycetaceae bacterium]
MPVILADVNVQRHVAHLATKMQAEPWSEFWNQLDLSVWTFADAGVALDASDLEIWLRCQAEGWILITHNRNRDSPESLEATIRRLNGSDSLPVFTIADLRKLVSDRDYAESVVERLYDYLFRLDDIRGTGRLYLP